MNVTLKIENDAELRTYIKECIKQQVLSIVRDEFLQIAKQEMERKIKGINTLNFERMLKSSLNDTCSDILYKDFGVNKWREDFITPCVSFHVNEAIKGRDWGKMIDDLAKEKVKSLIK